MSNLLVTTIQADLAWEDKPTNLRRLEAAIEGTPGKKEVVILPEMFSTGFSMHAPELSETMDGPTVEWMRQTAAAHHIILTGSLIIREGDHFFNRLIWMLPTGTLGYYDKRHLFGFAGEDQHYSPGRNRFIASVKGWRINLQICYDLRFPVWARQQSTKERPEYDILVYVANWPERRNHAWKTLLTARAIENQCFVVGVNRVGTDGNGIYHSGNSMVVSPMGETLYHHEHEPQSNTILLENYQLDECRSRLPFLRDADPFTLLNDPA
ncbi:amidohydrolase [Flavihumibacter petaseus]|uniref:Omega-amidase YafV n=1 Tax=Flavihumibacter petaseus NBRC 106054 TaxID=1220578 RepID=A0A0E9MYS2_9BACT|nr:amidohydrolase [Flavihumibacter petaseus]GAO42260.1 putative hydrolase [Flavihumibacter petaseus NBRC 106054]